jgi:hypothetical protein
MADVTYYRIDDGGAIARETDEWNREVYVPSRKEWVDAGSINFATDAREIDEAEVESEIGNQDFGEFGPEGNDEQTA